MADGSIAVPRETVEERRDTTVRARRKRLPVRRILLVAGPVVAIIVATVLYFTGGRWVSIDDAYVQADTVAVSTDVSGLVAEIAVRDNQQVEAGQLLFRLDDEPYRIALAQAEAQLGMVRNDVEATRVNYREKLAELSQAKADVDYFQREFDRQAELLRRSVASQAQYDQARHNLAVAQQKVVALQQQAESVLATLGDDADLPTEQQPRYQQAEAQVEKARRDLARTRVVAPQSGTVAKVASLQPGEMLQAGTPGFTLVATSSAWIEANPKETDLAHVVPGQPARVTIDAYPGLEWRGTVESVSPATGAQFAVLPAQNASGNWIKVVQRVPLRVEVATTPEAPPLRAGMSANVAIDTGHRRTIGDLFGSLFGSSRIVS